MQRRASIVPGATMAPVGHAGRHAAQLPQPFLDGGSAGSGSDTAISARST